MHVCICLTSIYTGHCLEDLQRNKYYDDYPMIWNTFKNNGYVTMFSEDTVLATFNLGSKVHFQKQPVDHYAQPFWSMVQQKMIRHRSPLCHSGQKRHTYALNYAKDLFNKYTDVPKFAFIFHNGLSHNTNIKFSQHAGEWQNSFYSYVHSHAHAKIYACTRPYMPIHIEVLLLATIKLYICNGYGVSDTHKTTRMAFNRVY